MKLSEKTVLPLDVILTSANFVISAEYANDVDPSNLKKSVMIAANSKRSYIPVGEIVNLTEQQRCVLMDSNIPVKAPSDFDPFR